VSDEHVSDIGVHCPWCNQKMADAGSAKVGMCLLCNL